MRQQPPIGIVSCFAGVRNTAFSTEASVHSLWRLWIAFSISSLTSILQLVCGSVG